MASKERWLRLPRHVGSANQLLSHPLHLPHAGLRAAGDLTPLGSPRRRRAPCGAPWM